MIMISDLLPVTDNLIPDQSYTLSSQSSWSNLSIFTLNWKVKADQDTDIWSGYIGVAQCFSDFKNNVSKNINNLM